MAQTPFSLLLLRRLCRRKLNVGEAPQPLFLFQHETPKHFSSLSSLQPDSTTSSSDPKPSSLSARMSFIFDQIDAIEKERFQKDETLQRIRAWRESKKNKNNPDDSSLGLRSAELTSRAMEPAGLDSSELEMKKKRETEGLLKKAVELVHPWPEWIELMERLVQQNYFDHRRKDEDKMIQDLGFEMSDVVEEGFDFTRDWKTVQTACLNFGRDRFDILRSLSRHDIQILVGYGCPSADKKVVFSAKLLRKHVHLDEGDVCSSCSLRNSCERAYLLTNKEDEARTIDVMRVLLTYGFDPVNGSVVNESLLKIKSVRTVVRKLLHEIVKLSAVPIDPNLPPPVIKKPPPKVKQPPPPPKKRVGRDDIEMKKGDWLCPKCDFMNFAKNNVCLQCDAKRPKRQLLPGEWECPECNFLNYRRNMVCFHCEHKRPADEFMDNQMQERRGGPRMGMEKVPNRAEVSNAWNFDFDDDESDGADVAAFEYADPLKMDGEFPLDAQARGEKFKGPGGFHMTSRSPRANEVEYADAGYTKPGMGFNDFDDEEDDVDSYEIDVQNNDQVWKRSSVEFSEVENFSESEDMEVFDKSRLPPHRTSSLSHKKPSRSMPQETDLSGSEDNDLEFDSDDELPVHRNWKSSHVANSRQRTTGRRVTDFGSDEEVGLSSGADDLVDEDFGSKQKGYKQGSNRANFGRGRSTNTKDEFFSGSESGYKDRRYPRERLRGSKVGPGRRGNNPQGIDDFDFSADSRHGFNGTMRNKRKPFNDNFNRSSRAAQRDDYDAYRVKGRKTGLQNFRGMKREGLDNHRCGRPKNSYNWADMGGDYEDERFRRPRINVR